MGNGAGKGNPERAAKRFRLKFPSTALLLLGVILLMAVLTHIIPAGSFDRVVDQETGRSIVVDGSYHSVEASPVGIWKTFQAPYYGFLQMPDIIAVLLLCGAVMGVVVRTEAVQAAIGVLVKKVGRRENLIILVMMFVFTIVGAAITATEAFVAFVPLIVMLALSLGYDRMTGVAIIMLGMYAGFSASPIGPFSIAIAQSIAQLPLLSGFWLRLLMCLGGMVIAMDHVLRYAKRVKKNPELGVNDFDERYEKSRTIRLEDYSLDRRKNMVLLLLAATVGIFVYGVIGQGWYFAEMAGLFMIFGILVGVVHYGGHLDAYMGDFMKSAEIMAPAVLLVALSRGVVFILTEGQIIDTIIYAMSLPLKQLNGVLAAWGIFWSQCILNLFIPSSSGQAVVAMPILTPLADLVGITRQVACTAYQCGDGYVNMMIPTHPVLLTSLGLAGIRFEKWFRFAAPLVLKWILWTMLFLAIGVKIGWGPF